MTYARRARRPRRLIGAGMHFRTERTSILSIMEGVRVTVERYQLEFMAIRMMLESWTSLIAVLSSSSNEAERHSALYIEGRNNFK